MIHQWEIRVKLKLIVSPDPTAGKPGLLEPAKSGLLSAPSLYLSPNQNQPQLWSSHHLSLVELLRPRCCLCSLKSTLRAGPRPATFAGSSVAPVEPMAWRQGLWSAVGDELPWMGVMAVSAELGRARCALELPTLPAPAASPYPSGPRIHLKHKVRRAQASFWFTKGSAQALAAISLAHPSCPVCPWPVRRWVAGYSRLSGIMTLEALGLDLNTVGKFCVEKVQRESFSQPRDYCETIKGRRPRQWPQAQGL